MKLLRFKYNRNTYYGVLDGSKVYFIRGDVFGKFTVSAENIPFSKARILTPVDASKVILAGLNYKEHAKELGMSIPKEPVIFIKPATSLLAHKGSVVYPKGVRRLDYEAELAVVIKHRCREVSEKDALKYVLGYTCLNDVTARDLQKKDGQWTRAKSFDTFCPVGPYIETDIEPSGLSIKSFVNGKIKQDSTTSDFIFSTERLISFISGVMTLYPGDIISTGTPVGVGPLKAGDTVDVQIEGIGTLSNKVV